MTQEERRRLRGVWREMFLRCFTPWHPSFYLYGARGITVVRRWNDFEVFLKDMGKRPVGHSIERVNNDGHYGPGNCIWATPGEQAKNRRAVGRVRCNGELIPFAEASRRTGIAPGTIAARLRMGWTDHEALSTKVRPWNHERRTA